MRQYGGEKGLTLLEVLIYAALSMIVLVLAVVGIGNLQKNAYRKQELSRLRGDADEAMRLFAQDARNLGLKRIVFSPSPGSLVDTQLTRVDYGPADSSSFRHYDGNACDTLDFLRPRLDANGKPIAIDTIRYAVDGTTGTLFRSVNGVSPVEIARQVDAFQFEFGLFAAKTILAHENPANTAHWGQMPAGTLTQAGSAVQAAALIAGTHRFWLSGTPVSLTAKHTYRLEFEAAGTSAFLGNVDSVYAMISNASGTPLARQSFLPANSNAPLTLTWSGISCSPCYCGFQMVMNGAGEFQLTSLKLTDVEQGDGAWVAKPTVAQKQAVRAFRVFLLSRSSQNLHGMKQEAVTLANASLTFNDKLGRGLLEDIVPIPNNGY
jgi:hypothetical protein